MRDEFARSLEAQLGSLFSGGSSPYSFRSWFASALWDADASADDDTLEFALQIENVTAERSGDHISDAEWLAALRSDAIAHYGHVPGLHVVGS